jgi:hypothetical protein
MKRAISTLLAAGVLGLAMSGSANNLGHPTLERCPGTEKLLASYYDLFNNLWLSRRTDEIDRWVDPEFTVPALPRGATHGPDIVKKFVLGVKEAFPKRHLFNDVVLCKDNIVSARQTVVAFNDGPFLGKPPSHNVTIVTWTDTYRFRDGRIYETYAADGDTVDTVRQIGWVLIPPGEEKPVTEPIPWIDRYPYAAAR